MIALQVYSAATRPVNTGILGGLPAFLQEPSSSAAANALTRSARLRSHDLDLHPLWRRSADAVRPQHEAAAISRSAAGPSMLRVGDPHRHCARAAVACPDRPRHAGDQPGVRGRDGAGRGGGAVRTGCRVAGDWHRWRPRLARGAAARGAPGPPQPTGTGGSRHRVGGNVVHATSESRRCAIAADLLVRPVVAAPAIVGSSLSRRHRSSRAHAVSCACPSLRANARRGRGRLARAVAARVRGTKQRGTLEIGRRGGTADRVGGGWLAGRAVGPAWAGPAHRGQGRCAAHWRGSGYRGRARWPRQTGRDGRGRVSVDDPGVAAVARRVPLASLLPVVARSAARHGARLGRIRQCCADRSNHSGTILCRRICARLRPDLVPDCVDYLLRAVVSGGVEPILHARGDRGTARRGLARARGMGEVRHRDDQRVGRCVRAARGGVQRTVVSGCTAQDGRCRLAAGGTRGDSQRRQDGSPGDADPGRAGL